jgi:hypothetical protein
MRIVAFLIDHPVVHKILRHLSLPGDDGTRSA